LLIDAENRWREKTAAIRQREEGMTTATVDTMIAASAEKLWDTIRRADNTWPWSSLIPAGVQAVESGQDGFTRTVNLPTGGSLVQRLEHVSDQERVYLLSITQSALPIADWITKIRVIDNSDGTSKVEWTSNFTPNGVPESDAAGAVRALYESGLNNLQRMFQK
jgi:hypothetical protein